MTTKSKTKIKPKAQTTKTREVLVDSANKKSFIQNFSLKAF